MAREMIIVTGVTGALGSAVVNKLLDHKPVGEVVGVTRSPAKAKALSTRGVSIRHGNFADAAGLVEAFSGATQVLVVSVNQLGEAAQSQHASAIRSARAAGADRVLYTSHMGASAHSSFAAAIDHAAAENVLAEAGSAFTALRHGFYAESALHMVGRDLASGELRVPEDGPVSWTTRADLAEGDAALLAGSVKFDGATPPLTASEALTMADLATIASEVSGRDIPHVTITDQEWLDGKVASGLPEIVARMLLGFFKAARRGDFATVDPTLEALLGRKSRAFRDVLGVYLKSSSQEH